MVEKRVVRRLGTNGSSLYLAFDCNLNELYWTSSPYTSTDHESHHSRRSDHRNRAHSLNALTSRLDMSSHREAGSR